MRPQKRETFVPDGPFLPMIFEVSASTAAGVVGWKEAVATVTAPASNVVSLPPLELLRVAQPEAQRAKDRVTTSESFDFMGERREGRWAAGKSFARLGIRWSGDRLQRRLLPEEVRLPGHEYLLELVRILRNARELGAVGDESSLNLETLSHPIPVGADAILQLDLGLSQ